MAIVIQRPKKERKKRDNKKTVRENKLEVKVPDEAIRERRKKKRSWWKKTRKEKQLMTAKQLHSAVLVEESDYMKVMIPGLTPVKDK